MTEEKKFYILGDVFHQDDTSPTELLGEVDDENGLSDRISSLVNYSCVNAGACISECNVRVN